MVVLTNKPGRLANRLFLFASFIADSLDADGYRVLGVSLDEYAPYFRRFAGSLCPRYPQPLRPCNSALRAWFRHLVYRSFNKLTRVLLSRGINSSRLHHCLVATHEDIFDLSDPRVRRQLRKPVVLIRNYFFHRTEALCRHRRAIAEVFRVDERRERAALDHARSVREVGVILVGVHIRRGDYLTWRGGQYYYSDSQYRVLMDRVKGAFSPRRVRFLVCSNEKVKGEAFGGLDWYGGPGGEIEDLVSLSVCDYILGPPSSYTRWAAFIGGVPLLVVEDPETPVTEEMFRDALDSPWARHETVQP